MVRCSRRDAWRRLLNRFDLPEAVALWGVDLSRRRPLVAGGVIKSSLLSVTVAASRRAALGVGCRPDVGCCAWFKLFWRTFDVLTKLAFSGFLVFIGGHSNVADFILFPFPDG